MIGIVRGIAIWPSLRSREAGTYNGRKFGILKHADCLNFVTLIDNATTFDQAALKTTTLLVFHRSVKIDVVVQKSIVKACMFQIRLN